MIIFKRYTYTVDEDNKYPIHDMDNNSQCEEDSKKIAQAIAHYETLLFYERCKKEDFKNIINEYLESNGDS